MTFSRPPRPVPNDMVKMTDRGLRLRQAGVTYSGLVKSINNSILVVLGLILLVAVHGGESLRPFGVNINVRDVRGQRPPFIMPRFDVLGLRRLRDLKQSNQDQNQLTTRQEESPDSDSEIAPEFTQPSYFGPFSAWGSGFPKRQGPRNGNPSHMNGIRLRNAIPLSIMDNIDTLRRGLMRELALRRLAQERHEMVKTSEELKNSLGKR